MLDKYDLFINFYTDELLIDGDLKISPYLLYIPIVKVKNYFLYLIFIKFKYNILSQ
jgi:hypothetical protein